MTAIRDMRASLTKAEPNATRSRSRGVSLGAALAGTLQSQQLMLEQQRFCDDGAATAGTRNLDQQCQKMGEQYG